MNKIYKIVWNKARQCYMVVCEYAKSQTKGCSTARLFANRRAMKAAAAVVMAGALVGLSSVCAEAAGTGSIEMGTSAEASGDYSNAIGYKAKASDEFSNAIGYNAIASGGDSIAIGSTSKASAQTTIAIGLWAQASDDWSNAIGSNAMAKGYASNAIGVAADAMGKWSNAIGYEAASSGQWSNAMGSEAKALAQNSIAIGTNALVSKPSEGSTAIGRSARVSSSFSNAIGFKAETSGNYSNAIGCKASASADYTNAIGYTAAASGENSNALGTSAAASGDYTNALGYSAVASADYTNAIGYSAEASGDSSVAIGDMAKAKSTNSQAANMIAIGTNAQAQNDNTTAIGVSSIASGANSVAIGVIAQATGPNSIAIGQGTDSNPTSATGQYAISVGYSSTASGQGVAIGQSSKARGLGIAIGTMASNNATSGSEEIAIGHNAHTEGKFGIAIGSAIAAKEYGIRIGDGGNGAANYAVGIGHTTNTSVGGVAVGSGALAASGVAIGRGADAKGPSDTWAEAIGHSATAVGYDAYADSINATALGADTLANTNSVAVGEHAKANGAFRLIDVSDYDGGGVAVGAKAVAGEGSSTVVGYKSTSGGSYGTAIGAKTHVYNSAFAAGYKANATAFANAVGESANAAGAYSDAYGYHAQTKATDMFAVALGSNSVSTAITEGVNEFVFGNIKNAEGKYVPFTFDFAGTKTNVDGSQVAALSIGHKKGDTYVDLQGVTQTYATDLYRQIKYVAAGEISATSTDAINGSQLFALTEYVKTLKQYTGTVTPDANKPADNDNTGLDAKDGVTIKVAPLAVTPKGDGDVPAPAPETPIKEMTNEIKTTDAGAVINKVDYKVTGANTDGGSNVVSSLTITATGEEGDTNSIKFNDTDTTYDFALDSAENGAINITSNTNDKWKIVAGNGITIDGDNTTKQFTINVGGSGADFLEAEDVGMGFKGDVGDEIKVGNNGTLKIVGGQTDASKLSDKPNIGVVNEGGDLKIKLAKDIDLGDGSLTLNKGGKTVKIEGDNVDMGGNQIHNVEAGSAPTDAVNVSQLKGLEGKVNNRINKVGARAAALAALHPLDFDPDDKLSFAAGYGHYKGENAGAIGAFYRPDEKVMFSVAGTVAEHDTMINAGISFSLDRTPRQTTTKTAMARDILEMKQQIAALAANNKALTAQNNQFLKVLGNATGLDGKPIEMSRVIMFPDVPENHWAYEYVEGLMQRGIIEGYPDGNYSGDRSCTRYEFAAMLYRALKAGQVVPAELTLEFASEIGRFRVDRVHGADDSNNKIERIRVNGDHNYGRDNYGSKNPQPVTSRGPQYPESAKVK